MQFDIFCRYLGMWPSQSCWHAYFNCVSDISVHFSFFDCIFYFRSFSFWMFRSDATKLVTNPNYNLTVRLNSGRYFTNFHNRNAAAKQIFLFDISVRKQWIHSDKLMLKPCMYHHRVGQPDNEWIEPADTIIIRKTLNNEVTIICDHPPTRLSKKLKT